MANEITKDSLEVARQGGPEQLKALIRGPQETTQEDRMKRARLAVSVMTSQMDALQKDEKMRLITAARSILEDMQTEITQRLRTGADQKLKDLQERMEKERQSIVAEELKLASNVEAAGVRGREAVKEIREGDWKTWAKYGAVVAGGAFAAKWLWDHSFGWLLSKVMGTKAEPGILRRVLGFVATAGGAITGALLLQSFRGGVGLGNDALQLGLDTMTDAGRRLWNNVPPRLKTLISEKGLHTMNVLNGKEKYTGDPTYDFYIALAHDGLGEFVIMGAGGYLVNSAVDLVWNIPAEMFDGLQKAFTGDFKGAGKQIVLAYVGGVAVWATSIGAIEKVFKGQPIVRSSIVWPYSAYRTARNTPIGRMADRYVTGPLLQYVGLDAAGRYREIRGNAAFSSALRTELRTLHGLAKESKVTEAIAWRQLQNFNTWDNYLYDLKKGRLVSYAMTKEGSPILATVQEMRVKALQNLRTMFVNLDAKKALPAWVTPEVADQIRAKSPNFEGFEEAAQKMSKKARTAPEPPATEPKMKGVVEPEISSSAKAKPAAAETNPKTSANPKSAGTAERAAQWTEKQTAAVAEAKQVTQKATWTMEEIEQALMKGKTFTSEEATELIRSGKLGEEAKVRLQKTLMPSSAPTKTMVIKPAAAAEGFSHLPEDLASLVRRDAQLAGWVRSHPQDVRALAGVLEEMKAAKGSRGAEAAMDMLRVSAKINDTAKIGRFARFARLAHLSNAIPLVGDMTAIVYAGFQMAETVDLLNRTPEGALKEMYRGRLPILDAEVVVGGVGIASTALMVSGATFAGMTGTTIGIVTLPISAVVGGVYAGHTYAEDITRSAEQWAREFGRMDLMARFVHDAHSPSEDVKRFFFGVLTSGMTSEEDLEKIDAGKREEMMRGLLMQTTHVGIPQSPDGTIAPDVQIRAKGQAQEYVRVKMEYIRAVTNGTFDFSQALRAQHLSFPEMMRGADAYAQEKLIGKQANIPLERIPWLLEQNEEQRLTALYQRTAPLLEFATHTDDLIEGKRVFEFARTQIAEGLLQELQHEIEWVSLGIHQAPTYSPLLTRGDARFDFRGRLQARIDYVKQALFPEPQEKTEFPFVIDQPTKSIRGIMEIGGRERTLQRKEQRRLTGQKSPIELEVEDLPPLSSEERETMMLRNSRHFVEQAQRLLKELRGTLDPRSLSQ